MGKTETKKKSPEPPFGRGKYLKKVVGFLSKTKKKFWTFKDWKIYIDLDTSRIIEEEVPLDFVLEYVKYSPSKIKTFDFLKKALSKNGLALQFCSDLRKSNMYLVLIAVRQNGFALQFANYQLKDSINIVKPAVEQNALALQFASNILKNYKEVVLTAVEQNGLALQFASNILKNNEEVVLTAVEQNGLALQFASDRLKKNKEVVLTAIRNNPDSYKYVSYILKNDREILEILGYNPQLIGLTNTINNINNIQQKKNQQEKDVCPICLDEFNPDKEFEEVPCCKKNFHSECLETWQQKSNTCPNCRKPLPPPTETHLPSKITQSILSDSQIEFLSLPENDYKRTLYDYIVDYGNFYGEYPIADVKKWEELWKSEGKDPPDYFPV